MSVVVSRTGECCCGATTVKVTTDPLLSAVCHCDNCKKRTGSAFGISSYFPISHFRILKDSTNTYTIENDHGKQVRHFCKHCGTTVFWYAEVFEAMVGVAAGCFTQHSLPQPGFNSMAENQYSWVTFPESMNKPLTAEDIPRV